MRGVRIQINKEYPQTINLQECLRNHIVYCLFEYPDQILKSDLVGVFCCNCGKEFKVPFDKLATEMFCESCKELEERNELIVTEKHIESMKQRIRSIRNKLIGK